MLHKKPLPEPILINDFITRQTPYKTHFAGRTKCATHGATYLRRNANRPISASIFHEHCFNFFLFGYRDNRFIRFLIMAGNNGFYLNRKKRNFFFKNFRHFLRKSRNLFPIFYFFIKQRLFYLFFTKRRLIRKQLIYLLFPV